MAEQQEVAVVALLLAIQKAAAVEALQVLEGVVHWVQGEHLARV